ncbi:MAG: exodeoxyribonuclease III [Clostridiales bacterium]|nr:exodeoxyribonuclease III [Clostridiales bacterium]
MKLLTWNVNGLRAALKKGFYESILPLDADIIALQETKLQPEQAEVDIEGYHQYYNSAEKKGYSGTAVFTRVIPQFVYHNFDAWRAIDEKADIPIGFESEGRILTLEFSSYYFVNCYTPNSQRELTRLDYRMEWEDLFRDFLKALNKIKPVILCGDLNVAHEEIDIKNPKTNRNNAGFTDKERSKMTELLGAGFIDAFRLLYPEKTDAYTWWSYFASARDRNIGWRIDYFVVSEALANNIKECIIHDFIMGSDHCPVELIIDLEEK